MKGILYTYTKKFHKSNEYHLKAIDIYFQNNVAETDKKGDLEKLADLFKYIGLNLVEMGEYAESNKYLDKAMEIYKRLDSKHASIERTQAFIDVNNQYLRLK